MEVTWLAAGHRSYPSAVVLMWLSASPVQWNMLWKQR
jgi:hypothetical protein